MLCTGKVSKTELKEAGIGSCKVVKVTVRSLDLIQPQWEAMAQFLQRNA